jgi:hypothetical protein
MVLGHRREQAILVKMIWKEHKHPLCIKLDSI